MNPYQFFTRHNIQTIEASGGRELRIICSYCKNEKQKCYVNTESGNWYCFHCGMGGSFKMLVEKLELPTTGITFNLQESKNEFEMTTPIPEEDILENHNRLIKMLETDQALQNYFYKKRGYTIETIKKFKLGWGEGRNISIPIYTANGECMNFKLKHDPTVPIPARGMFSIEGRGKKRIFNESALTVKTKKDKERIIICEGEWDAMLLTQMGYKAVTSTAGAMSFDESWISAFAPYDKIYVCFDKDKNETGQKATKRIAELFIQQGIRIFIVNLPFPWPEEEKVDVTDFFVKRKKTKENFTQLLKNAQEFSGRELEAETYRFIDGLTLHQMEFPENKWIVDKFIQEAGVTCIAGPGGSGKSFFTLYLASCISQGLPVLSKFNTQNSNILFIDKENAIPWTKERLKKFKIPDTSLQKLYFMSSGNFMIENKEAIEQVNICIEKHNIKLVVIDTLIKIHTGEEISSTDIDKISKVFFEFQKRGAAVLFVHHFVKETGAFPITNVVSALRGSSHIYNMVDNYFAYYIKKGILRLDMAKARNDELLKPFKIDCYIGQNEIDYHYVGEITDEEENSYQRVSCEEELIKILRVSKKTRKELITSMSHLFSTPTIDRAISSLRKMERIESQANGREMIYFSTEKEYLNDIDRQLGISYNA